jgi:hypothetical protein
MSHQPPAAEAAPRAPASAEIPLRCPRCGCQTRSPFDPTRVIHDVPRCAGISNNAMSHERP